MLRRLQAELDREGKGAGVQVVVGRQVLNHPAYLIAALSLRAGRRTRSREYPRGEAGRERDLQELFRRGRKPVALFVDEAHDLHAKTLTGLKRLMEVVADGGGTLSIVLVGYPKLRNDLRRPTMEEIGYRVTNFRLRWHRREPARVHASIGCSEPAPSRKRNRQS